MGKHGKKHRESPRHRSGGGGGDVYDDSLPSAAYDLPLPTDQRELSDPEEKGGNDDGDGDGADWSSAAPSKFHLYQISVQSPKGDISYMQKFFLMYIGGRFPLHLQEDFCGTALLSCEWLRSDPRRTAVGVDLDLESLNWCFDNNLGKLGADGYSRISLFHGSANATEGNGSINQITSTTSLMEKSALPNRDIVCAFNYSCCCLHKRRDLLLYFKHALNVLSKKGGIFVMDLYGGVSSECKLRLQRRFSNFTYVWEQEEFDILNRRTRISLHFHLEKQRTIRHAFSYDWRLWSIPEIKDCLEEAGFRSTHVWIRKMPDTLDDHHKQEFNADRDVKYEELSLFQQEDAWNAYIVGVANT